MCTSCAEHVSQHIRQTSSTCRPSLLAEVGQEHRQIRPCIDGLSQSCLFAKLLLIHKKMSVGS